MNHKKGWNLTESLALQQVKDALGSGADIAPNGTNATTNWDIGSCFFFAGTVITTIGNGLFNF